MRVHPTGPRRAGGGCYELRNTGWGHQVCSMGCRCFNTHVRNTRSVASPRVSTSPKGSAQSLSQLGPTAQWGRLRKEGLIPYFTWQFRSHDHITPNKYRYQASRFMEFTLPRLSPGIIDKFEHWDKVKIIKIVLTVWDCEEWTESSRRVAKVIRVMIQMLANRACLNRTKKMTELSYHISWPSQYLELIWRLFKQSFAHFHVIQLQS